ncbi:MULTISPECIES: response regulator transcription factor [Hungatella]|jgi:two-component system response regulator YesN|uniref:response regulator transcription factor n=1 Tax=Hungatella TaxID=1649459 RepID=UPI0011DE2D5E|nr:response regulator [Hungatella hathewayi]
MIKVLIIDDEPLVRVGMKSIIPWEEHGYMIAGEAGNGVSGLEKIFECKPDLVLIDIMMPLKDGLTVIAEAKKGGFGGKFIILSCVSEFEYLQKAIHLGVSSYILKSAVKPQEILETVEEAAKEIRKGKLFPDEYCQGNREHFAFNEFLNLVLRKIIVKKEDIEEKMAAFGLGPQNSVYLLVNSVKDTGRECKKVLYRVASIGGSLLDEAYWGSCFVDSEDYVILFLACCSMKEAEELSFRLKTSAKQYFDVRLETEIKRIQREAWDISSQYEEAKQELSMSFFETTGEEKKELIPATEYATYEKLSTALEMIKNMMLQSRIVTETEAKKVYAGAVEYVILMFELVEDECLKEMRNDADTVFSWLNRLDSFGQVHRETLRLLEKCYELAGKNGFVEYEDELTDGMVKYIHSHCNSRISAKDVAEHVHFSVDYTCKYFKKKTQTNLTDYILKLKVYRSHKELMEGKSLAEIADTYGFSSDGHYVKVFKKYEGMTPGMFVKKNKNNV